MEMNLRQPRVTSHELTRYEDPQSNLKAFWGPLEMDQLVCGNGRCLIPESPTSAVFVSDILPSKAGPDEESKATYIDRQTSRSLGANQLSQQQVNDRSRCPSSSDGQESAGHLF